MKKKCLLFLILISPFVHSQVDLEEMSYTMGVKNTQKLAANIIKQNYHKFGGPGITTESIGIYIDDSTGAYFYLAKYKKDKMKSNGRTYYDVNIEVEIAFKNISSVHLSGDSIVLYFKKSGLGWGAKTDKNGYWSKYSFTKSITKIPIKDDDARAEAFSAYKFLVKHPYKSED